MLLFQKLTFLFYRLKKNFLQQEIKTDEVSLKQFLV